MTALTYFPQTFKHDGIFRAQNLSQLLTVSLQLGIPAVTKTRIALEKLEAIASLLGSGMPKTRRHERVREISVSLAKTESIGLTHLPHLAHTDGCYINEPPSYFMLGVKKADTGGGGVSQFWDTTEILTQLNSDELKMLREETIQFTRQGDNGPAESWAGPLLSNSNSRGWKMRWRYDQQVKPIPVGHRIQEMHSLINKIKNIIQNMQPIEYAAQAGDLILVPNERWLHGRTGLTVGSDRMLLRCWIE